jgi:hypothetical protein
MGLSIDDARKMDGDVGVFLNFGGTDRDRGGGFRHVAGEGVVVPLVDVMNTPLCSMSSCELSSFLCDLFVNDIF